jgi:hypothetical protein
VDLQPVGEGVSPYLPAPHGRRINLRRNSVHNGSTTLEPTFIPRTWRWPSVLTTATKMTATLTARPASRVFRLPIGRVDPQVLTIAFARALQEVAHTLVQLFAQQ